MITVKSVQLKNFLSTGSVTQTVNLNTPDLTLILGENLDLGGDGSRNGVGKTALIQAISYALFGQALNNIKRDNLINRTNGKGMLVTIDFSVGERDYRIMRGRKPNILKFYVNNQEQQITEDSQGENRETQQEIERILSMTPDMFRQLIALNTYNESFLSMKVSDQRLIIEQLLGITLLSEKAEKIKELNKKTKDQITQEEFKVRGVQEANKRVQEQIDSLKKRQRLWRAKRDEDLNKLITEYEILSQIDIDTELAAHQALGVYVVNQEKLARYNSLLARQTAWSERQQQELAALEKTQDTLNQINIEQELQFHKDLATYKQQVKDSQDYDAKLKRLKQDCDREFKLWSSLDSEINTLKEHKCYACGQEFHDATHADVLEKKKVQAQNSSKALDRYHQEIAVLEANPIFVCSQPVTHYASEAEAFKHSNELEKIQEQIQAKKSEIDPYLEQIQENFIEQIGVRPLTHYDTETEAIKHSSRVASLEDQIQRKHSDVDPYIEQIADMENQAIQTVDFTVINQLTKQFQHQDYLLDLLTNKKSFVRKRIIQQNLSYLNGRLSHYLAAVGLPHQVIFQDDLSVTITELGRELDYGNLSRGESNRLVLGLSFAFRDVYENLYNPVNVLFVDELIDSGMDTLGVENSIALLKDFVRRRNKSVWLVSHKDELVSRVDSVLNVTKSNGFTTYEAVSSV